MDVHRTNVKRPFMRDMLQFAHDWAKSRCFVELTPQRGEGGGFTNDRQSRIFFARRMEPRE